MIPSSAETGRSVYQIGVAVADTKKAQAVIAGIFCPDPDHAGPCPVPWESRSIAGHSVHFVFYATDDQAREILAEVSTQGFGEVRLFKSADEHGEPIDGSDVIEQFHTEHSPPENGNPAGPHARMASRSSCTQRWQPLSWSASPAGEPGDEPGYQGGLGAAAVLQLLPDPRIYSGLGQAGWRGARQGPLEQADWGGR